MTASMASRLTRLAALGLVAVGLAACTSPAPPATPTKDVRRDKAEVEFRIVHNVELKPGHTITATFSDGRQTRTLAQSEFTAIQEGHFIAGPFDIATTGDLKLSGALVDQGGSELAKGTVTLPLESDRRYGVWILIGSDDPTAGCLGCAGSRAFPLDPSLGYAPDVALAIVWGGNSISDPVVY